MPSKLGAKNGIEGTPASIHHHSPQAIFSGAGNCLVGVPEDQYFTSTAASHGNMPPKVGTQNGINGINGPTSSVTIATATVASQDPVTMNFSGPTNSWKSCNFKVHSITINNHDSGCPSSPNSSLVQPVLFPPNETDSYSPSIVTGVAHPPEPITESVSTVPLAVVPPSSSVVYPIGAGQIVEGVHGSPLCQGQTNEKILSLVHPPCLHVSKKPLLYWNQS